MSYYGSQPGGQPEQPYQEDPYRGQQPQQPGDPYGQPPPADPYYGMPPGDPYASGQQQPPPQNGWQQPYPDPWQGPPARQKESSNTGAVLVGIFLVLLGVWFLFRDEIALDFSQLWPAAAVALGVVMVVAAFIPRRRRA